MSSPLAGRLLPTLRLDVRLQARNGLYVVGLAVAVCIGAVTRYFLGPEDLRFFLPALLLMGLGSTTYFFAAGMVIFEKGERTLDVQIVTPLRTGEYLLSKVLTLTLFALVESVVLLTIAYGFDVRWLPLTAGLCLMGALFSFCALAQVVRFDVVTDFLIPTAFVFSLIAPLPVLGSLRVWETPLWYLWPSQAPLLLLGEAFRGPGSPALAPWQWLYVAGYGGLGLWITYLWARRAFERHVLGGAIP